MPTGRIFMADVPSREDLWVPITIRVAWELYIAGFRVRPQTLQCCREHVLRSLPADVSPEVAERLAQIFTHDFVERFQHNRYRRPNIDDDVSMEIPQEWRVQLKEHLESTDKIVFRLHYRDGCDLDGVAKRARIPMKRVLVARSRIHTILYKKVLRHTLDIRSWSDTRIDLLLSRIANTAEISDILPEDILSPEGRPLVERCPRLNKAYRLIGQGILSLHDLQPPAGATIPEGRLSLLSLLLHPDARQHASLVRKALKSHATKVSGDAWLIPHENLPDVHEALAYLAEANSPPRHYFRGSLISGPGRWFKGMLLGPLPVRALEAARSRPWGDIDGIDALPPPLPPPPKSSAWWLGAVVSMTIAMIGLLWAMQPEEIAPMYPMQPSFYSDTKEVMVRFDVSDQAYVDVITFDKGQLEVKHHALFHKKGQLATGDGRYFFRDKVDKIALISSHQPIASLGAIVQVAQGDTNPIQYLQNQISKRHPDAHVLVSPSRKSDKDSFFDFSAL